jgi:signal transduction histidine kinase
LQTPEFYANLWQTILSGQSWHGELFNKRKDGSIYPEEQTITPVLNENREITYYVAIKRDISQRKELEGLRKDMTNMFLHDLRTPLNQIMLALSLLSSKDKPEENTELLTIAENGTKRMNEMLNDLLAIGRLEEGQMSVDWVEVNLHELAEEALENQHLQADNQKVQLVNAIAPDFPLVVASAHLLNRVLQNLIANAMRFTPAGGSITVSAAEALGNRVRVEVTDTGKGIDPKIEFKLFEKYASSGGGLGLGLSFCRLAINIHQGKITARNRPQGGAVFTFEIPTGGPDRSTTNSV